MTTYYRVLDTKHKLGNWSRAMESHWIVFSRDPKKFDTQQTELFSSWAWAHEDHYMEREPYLGQCSHIGRCKPVKKEELPKKVYDAFMVFLSDNPWKETEFKEC